jgi:hypothetical protein
MSQMNQIKSDDILTVRCPHKTFEVEDLDGGKVVAGH